MIKKITVEYDDEKEASRALKVDAVYRVLWDTAQEVFRPARKHGYPDTETNNLLVKSGDCGTKLVSALEQKFYDIMYEHDVNLSDME